jgi:GNAT superfamily N-acetyltransferase
LPPHCRVRGGVAVSGAVRLRPGRDEDAEAFIRIVDGCWSEYPGCVTDIDGEAPELRTLATYCAGRGGAVWAAERDGSVIGLVCTYPLADGAWELAKMYVAPEARGAGAAHLLAEAVEAHARAQGATRLHLWSDTRFDRAHRFYEKRSFVRSGPIRALGDKSNSIEYAYAKPLTGLVVDVLDAAAAASAEVGLARVLVACVEGGASVSFMAPMSTEKARGFWRETARAVARGERVLCVAWHDGEIVGTVQACFAGPENQPHRADIAKMLVHPAARRLGIGAALLARAEEAAGAAGRWVLVLDTGSAEAERLYRRGGWIEVGVVPNYALNPDGTPCDTIFFYKNLVPRPGANT